MISLEVIDPSVTCTDCGRCCSEMRTPPHMVWYRNGEYQPMSSYQSDFDLLMAAPVEARELRTSEMLRTDLPIIGPCSWLDQTKQCRYYEWRPQICRDFTPGCRDCLEWRARLKGMT